MFQTTKSRGFEEKNTGFRIIINCQLSIYFVNFAASIRISARVDGWADILEEALAFLFWLSKICKIKEAPGVIANAHAECVGFYSYMVHRFLQIP